MSTAQTLRDTQTHQDTETLEFKFPVEVALHISSVTDDWIEGDLTFTHFGKKDVHPFKTKNNAPLKFDIPIIDASVDGKVFLSNSKTVCADGNVEKKIIFDIKVPFHVCKGF